MENFVAGFMALMNFNTILFMLIGTVAGLIIGALPGLTGNMAIALMVPVTFTMKPTAAIAFLVAIYCSSIFGGSISAILLGIPGTISSFATTLDGYPMAKKGQAGRALGISTMASVFGGLFSAVVLTFLTTFLAEVALKFGPAEYFAVAVLGLCCISSIGGKSLSKGLLSGMIGLFVAMIGMDPQSGAKRFTFGNINLLDGIQLVPALMGLFGVCAVLKSADKFRSMSQYDTEKMPDVKGVWIGWKECFKLLSTFIRGSVIGTIIGIIPGAGTNVATVLAYDTEKKFGKDGNTFGKGNPRGVAAPESANNAVTGGSMVPLLALGVPGNSTSALFLGALMLQGLSTGPVLFTEHADIAYGIFISFFLVNLLMWPLGMILLRWIKKVLAIPEALLNGIVLALCATGCYALSSNPFDVLIVIIFGLVGYLFYKFEIPAAPLIVCLVLGSMAESQLRQALVISKGSYNFLWTRPVTAAVMIVALISFFVPIVSNVIKMVRQKRGIVSAFDQADDEEIDDDD